MIGSRQHHTLLIKFMLLSLFGGMGMGVSQLATTLYAIELGANSAQIGLIGGIQGVGLLLTVVPIGFLVDHVGPKKIFIFGGVVCAVIYLFFSYIRTPQLLLWFVAVIGFFTSFRFIPMSSVFFEFLSIIGNEKAGWQRGSHSIGLVFIGPLLGALLVKYFGYTATFYAVSASLVLLIIGAAGIFPGKATSAVPYSLQETYAHLKELLRDRNILEAAGAEGLALATFSCFNAFIIVIAIRVFHLTPQIASLFVSLEGLIFISTLFTLWRLVQKLSQRRFYLTSITIIVLGLALLSCVSHSAFLVAGTIMVGIGLGLFNLINVTRVARSKIAKGKIAGFFAAFTVFGSILGPIIGGFVGENIGLGALFLVFIPFYLAFGLKIYLNHDSVDAADENCLQVKSTEGVLS